MQKFFAGHRDRQTVKTHKHEEEDGFLRLGLTALTFTLRIWQSAMKQERSQQCQQNNINPKILLDTPLKIDKNYQPFSFESKIIV